MTTLLISTPSLPVATVVSRWFIHSLAAATSSSTTPRPPPPKKKHPTHPRHCFDLLVASLCPAIFGHELVKAGLLLTLFGGTKRQNDAGASALRTRVRVRSDPHILLVVRSLVACKKNICAASTTH